MAPRHLSDISKPITIGILLVSLFLGLFLILPQNASADVAAGSGGNGGGTGGGPWGWTHYGNGWASYDSSGPGPSASPKINNGSWSAASSACKPISSRVLVYIIGTGVGPSSSQWPKANGEYMGYNYNSHTSDGSLWTSGGTVDNSRAIKVGPTAAQNAWDALDGYGLKPTNLSYGGSDGNVAWFCYGIYPTNVTPIVTRVASPVARTVSPSFRLARTVTKYTSPNKITNYRIYYRFNNAGTWLPIPTAVSTIYDSQLQLKLTANTTNDDITPNLVFPASLIPTTANSVCVQMAFVGTPPTHVTYGAADYDCVNITNPPAGWQVYGSSVPVKNGAGGGAGGVLHVSIGDKFKFQHSLTNATSSSTVSPAISYSGVNTQSVIVNLPSGSVSSLNIGQTSSLLSTTEHLVDSNDVGKTFCQAIDFTPASNVNSGHSQSAPACVVVDPPALVCNQTLSTSPTRLQPGEVVSTIRLAFPASGDQTLTYSIPGLVPDTTVNISAKQGSYDITNVTLPNVAKDYDATWSVSDAIGNCTGTISVVDMPYFSVYGASVRTGGDFAGSCTGGGNLASWRNYSGGSNYGAGTELSAIAMIGIVGFASKDTVPASASPVALSFANPSPTSGGDSPKLGGNYGGSYCFSNPSVPATGVTDVSGSPSFSATDKDGAYKSTNDIELRASTIGIGQNTSLFVDGDVNISGNISYTGGWLSKENVPSFVLVATGNITIEPDVTNLDGLYVAKPSGSSKGQIYTCFNATIFTSCNRQLVVHGSFVAKKINLQRSLGTLRDDARHSNVGCQNSGDINSSRPTCAAEVFEFSPEMYLSSPAIKPQSNGTVHYDSIVNLAPIL